MRFKLIALDLYGTAMRSPCEQPTFIRLNRLVALPCFSPLTTTMREAYRKIRAVASALNRPRSHAGAKGSSPPALLHLGKNEGARRPDFRRRIGRRLAPHLDQKGAAVA